MKLSRLLKYGLRTGANVLTSVLLPSLARWRYGNSLDAYPPAHLVYVGDQYLFRGRQERALQFYLLACEREPNTRFAAGSSLLTYVNGSSLDTETYFTLLRTLAAAATFIVPDVERALLLKLLDRDPNRLERELENIPPQRLSHDAVYALGSKALGIGRNKLALIAYRRALLLQPNSPSLLEQIGVTEFLTGLYQEAERSFLFADFQKQLDREYLKVDDHPYAVLAESWHIAIGHVAFLDTYIKACRLGWYPHKKTLLVYNAEKPPAGWPLFKFFSKHIEIVPTSRNINDEVDEIVFKDRPENSEMLRDKARTALTRPFWYGPDADSRIRWFGPFGAAVERAWKEQGQGALFSLSSDERERFRQTMFQIYGLPQDAWFVVLHVREPGFHSAWHAYHAGTRNAEIKSYDKVIDFVLSKGGWVVRAGDSSMSALEPRVGVIDYAVSAQKHPALDIYLCADCSYFIGTNSGFSIIPPLFGKRCGLTNWSPIAIPNWYLDDLYIPKLVRKTSENRYLSFEEMYGSFTGWSQFARDFVDTDFVIEDNTPEDLLELARELHTETFDPADALDGADRSRLRRFNDIATTYGSYVGSRIGAGFLRKYAHLLQKPASEVV